MVLDPLGIRTPTVPIGARIGTTMTDGWAPMVTLTDGQQVGPVQLVRPAPMGMDNAGGVPHKHRIRVPDPKAGAGVLVITTDSHPVGVLL